MSDSQQISHEADDAPANLAALVVRQSRYARRLRLHGAFAREQRKPLRTALAEAVTMIGTLSRQLDRARKNSDDRAEHNRALQTENVALRCEIDRLSRPRAEFSEAPRAYTAEHGAIQ